MYSLAKGCWHWPLGRVQGLSWEGDPGRAHVEPREGLPWQNRAQGIGMECDWKSPQRACCTTQGAWPSTSLWLREVRTPARAESWPRGPG